MSITKRQGVGGKSSIRKLSKIGDQIISRADIDPNSRNGRRVMQKLRAKYGDEVIDRELEKLKDQS